LYVFAAVGTQISKKHCDTTVWCPSFPYLGAAIADSEKGSEEWGPVVAEWDAVALGLVRRCSW
jgi:hypothetical protein